MDIETNELLDKVSANYQWPDPSCSLQQKIMQEVGPRLKRKPNYQAVFFDFVFSRWEPALAFALILGICTGTFTISQTSSSFQTKGIYADADFIYARSIVKKYNKEEKYD